MFLDSFQCFQHSLQNDKVLACNCTYHQTGDSFELTYVALVLHIFNITEMLQNLVLKKKKTLPVIGWKFDK